MSWGIVAAVGGSVVGGLISADGAQDAAGTSAQATTEATRLSVEEQRRQFDKVQELLAPYMSAGEWGLSAYRNLSGVNGAGMQQHGIDFIQNGAEYGSLVKQAENAILQNASATGGLRGGNVQGALGTTRSNILSSLIERQLGRYAGLAQMGQNSASRALSAALTTGQGIGAATMNGGVAAGNVLAGGQLAGTNALVNTIGGVGGLLASRFGGAAPAAAAPALVPGGFGTGNTYGNQDFGQYF